MKASELRIGNLLECHGAPSPIGVGLLVMMEKRMDMSAYKPIALTEEWLGEFGFEKWNSGKHSMFWNKKGITINTNGFYFNYSQGEKSDRANVQYVHQLQNLYFALTGEELKIK